MTAITSPSPAAQDLRARKMLLDLGFQPHLLGFRQLCIAIDRFALGDIQSMSKELYPFVAVESDTTLTSVEHSVRYAITDAWSRRDPQAWARYFPDPDHAPSNKEFIATLATNL